MFGIGHLPELLLIMVLALIFVGPGKLPEMGGAIGKSIREFRKATSEMQESFTETPPARQIAASGTLEQTAGDETPVRPATAVRR